MEEKEAWDLEVESIQKQELTEDEKRLALAYAEFDMLSRDILPIFDFSLEDKEEGDEE